MWAPATNLDGLDEAYTSCPRPSSCGAWNGSARLSRDAGGEQLGPVPLIQLIGTRKGGTTALSDHMLAHPHLLAPDCSTHKREWPRVAQVRMCVWDKEVRYFSRGFPNPNPNPDPNPTLTRCATSHAASVDQARSRRSRLAAWTCAGTARSTRVCLAARRTSALTARPTTSPCPRIRWLRCLP